VNSFGQLGLEIGSVAIPTLNEYFVVNAIKIIKISAKHNLSAAISNTGNLYIWGEGFHKIP